ncbi:MAG TPA: Holliday junction resolvase RuvX [Acidimicrobiales bacterium]|nr:Holliday junction resolvase RuvX [Acidimicrobiales bacterium]
MADGAPDRADDPARSAATSMTQGRAVGIDLGSRRIGVAVSNSGRTLASPRSTVERTGDRERDRRALIDLVMEVEARVVVVGLPLSLDGSRGTAAVEAEAEADALRSRLQPQGVAVELFDERLTTVTAHQSLAAGGRRSKARRKVIDRSAATVLLQAWLEAQRDSR